MRQTARLFKNGRSQAVRLPAAFRLESEEVYIRRDPTTGDVILSAKPRSFDRFFAALAEGKAPDDFLNSAEREQGPAGFPGDARDHECNQSAKSVRGQCK